MELASISTPAAAFVAGLVTSLHCAGMCGPLACWLAPAKPQDDATTIAATYQASRLVGYAVLGGIAGAIGTVPLLFLSPVTLNYLPWAMVVFFIAVALRWDKKMPRFVPVVRLTLKIQSRLRGYSRLSAAAILGVVTPLLPCGPLYFLITLAALSGSALRGVEFMLAFGLGTLPLLWFSQANFGWMRARISPTWFNRVQVTLAVVSALVISWRLRSTLGFAGPTITQFGCF